MHDFNPSPCYTQSNAQYGPSSHVMLHRRSIKLLLLVVFPTVYPCEQQFHTACRRFATITFASSGFGHKFGDLVLGHNFAFENDAIYVLPDRNFDIAGRHGAYAWANRLLGLHAIQLASEVSRIYNLTTVKLRNFHQPSEFNDRCGILLVATDNSCHDLQSLHIHETDFCFNNKVGAYQAAKSTLRRYFRNSTHRPELQYYSPLHVSVAWHVRDGDLTLNANKRYFDNVFSLIRSLLQSTRHDIFIFSEKKLTAPFDFLKNERVSFVYDISPQETFCRLVSAQILITSGSSFSAAAAIYADGVVLQRRSKEAQFGKSDGVYETFDQPLLDIDGTLLRPSLDDVKRRVEELVAKPVRD